MSLMLLMLNVINVSLTIIMEIKNTKSNKNAQILYNQSFISFHMTEIA